jgi:hypothetical protein
MVAVEMVEEVAVMEVATEAELLLVMLVEETPVVLLLQILPRLELPTLPALRLLATAPTVVELGVTPRAHT